MIVASNFADLIDGSLSAPITITQNGAAVDGGSFSIFAWTGTAADGTSVPGRTCSNWTDATNNSNAKAGFPGVTNGSWTDGQNIGCAGFGSDHLYCVQQ